MRNFSFVVQSGTTLDAPSMKSVRSHVTREQMKKRRSQLEKQEGKQGEKQGEKSEPRKSRATRSKAAKKAKGKKKEEADDDVEEVEIKVDDEDTTPQLPSPTTTNASSVALASTPSAQLSGTTAEFTTMPFSKRRMSEFFNRYYEFMGLYSVTDAGVEMEYSPFAGFLQQESFTNPAWLTSIALVATQKLDIYRERESVDLLKYKALALQALNKKIKDPEVEETTILAVVAFFAFEVLNSDGNPQTEGDVLAHYHGLLAYIKSKGGPEALAEQSPAYGVFIVRAALTYEMIYALKRARDPLSVIIDTPRLRTFLPAPDGTREPYFVGGPLLWPSSIVEHGSPEALEALENHHLFTAEIKAMLFDLFTATQLLYMEYHYTTEDTTRSSYAALRDSIQLPPEPSIDFDTVEKRASATARIARACWLAGCVYLRAVVQQIPFTDPINAEPITELHQLLKNLDIQAWSTMPYIHLWIGLVGIGAAVNPTQKRFYAVQIGRCGILFGSRWWDNYRQVVVNFLWLQKLLRGEIPIGGAAQSSIVSNTGLLLTVLNIDVPLVLNMDSAYPLTPPDSLRDTWSPDDLEYFSQAKT